MENWPGQGRRSTPAPAPMSCRLQPETRSAMAMGNKTLKRGRLSRTGRSEWGERKAECAV